MYYNIYNREYSRACYYLQILIIKVSILKKVKCRKFIPLIMAALIVLPVCSGIFAKEDAQEQYYFRVLECINNDINPLDDMEIEQTVRTRLKDFELTQEEADAVIITLKKEQTAPDYRNLYLISLFDYKCSTKENHATSYYSDQDNTVHIGRDVAPNNFINVFFHESAHAIHLNLNGNDDSYASSRQLAGQKIYDALTADVRNSITDRLSDMSSEDDEAYTAAQMQIIAGSFINGEAEPLFESTEYDKDTLITACMDVKTLLESEMSLIPNSNASMVSDIYGGVTNNKIIGNMGHPVKKLSPDGTAFYYWYDEDGNPTGNQVNEAWAEYFSAIITGDEYNIQNNEFYFPTAAEELDELEDILLKLYLERE